MVYSPQPGSMFGQAAGWGSSSSTDWYGASMGPPSGHTPRTTSQLSFDQAYNFGGNCSPSTVDID